MRGHLNDCESCRAYYERHLVLEQLDPRALGSEERIARALGFARGGRARFNWRLAVPVFASAAAVLLVVTLAGRTAPWGSPDGFVARGGGENVGARLEVYRIQREQQPAPLGDRAAIAAHDELAFAYQNPRGKPWLLVFGVDEHDNVYWYHPAWLRADEDPRAVAIAAGAAVHELPEAVSHELRGDTLRVYGVFTEHPMTVRQVESLLGEVRGQPAQLPFPDAEQASLFLRVRKGAGSPTDGGGR